MKINPLYAYFVIRTIGKIIYDRQCNKIAQETLINIAKTNVANKNK